MTFDQLMGNWGQGSGGYGGLGTPQSFYNQANQQYGQLQQNVLGSIQGVGASQAQAIQDTYAQQSGAAQQSLAQRGLGNTTVVDATQRGLTLDEQKAQVALQFYGQQQGYAQQQQMQQQQFANQWATQNPYAPLNNLNRQNDATRASYASAAGGLGYAGAYGTRSF